MEPVSFFAGGTKVKKIKAKAGTASKNETSLNNSARESTPKD